MRSAVLNRLRYLSEVLGLWGGGAIAVLSALGIYDLFLSQFLSEKTQTDFPRARDVISGFGWQWSVVALSVAALIIFFEGSYRLMRHEPQTKEVRTAMRNLTQASKEDLWRRSEIFKRGGVGRMDCNANTLAELRALGLVELVTTPSAPWPNGAPKSPVERYHITGLGLLVLAELGASDLARQITPLT